MKIGVVGLWHLGTVAAACSAAAGHDVIAVETESVIAGIGGDTLPVAEPVLGGGLLMEQWVASRPEGRHA